METVKTAGDLGVAFLIPNKMQAKRWLALEDRFVMAQTLAQSGLGAGVNEFLDAYIFKPAAEVAVLTWYQDADPAKLFAAYFVADRKNPDLSWARPRAEEANAELHAQLDQGEPFETLRDFVTYMGDLYSARRSHEEHVDADGRKAQLTQSLKTTLLGHPITYRQREILMMRNGLNRINGLFAGRYTGREIAQVFKVSGPRISDINTSTRWDLYRNEEFVSLLRGSL